MLRIIAGSALLFGDGLRPPLANGSLAVDSAGTIVAVGNLAELVERYPSADVDQRRAVLTPGLVNAHTHLELTSLRGRVPGGRGFVPWLRALMKARGDHAPELDLESIDSGVGALLRAGTAAVGEVTNSLQAVEALSSAPLIGRVFHEVFGAQKIPAIDGLAAARDARAKRQHWPGNLSYALSPHSAHGMHPDLLDAVLADRAQHQHLASIHVAEHAAERAFMMTGAGPFAEFLREVGRAADFEPPSLDSVTYLQQRGALSPQLLLVHLSDARAPEIALVAQAGCGVVLCPRSNLHIEVRLPPLTDILEAGLRPALGTDSLASAPDLDVLGEARALHARFPSVAPRTFLAMAMDYGARALGLGHRVGRLEVGLAPGILAFPHGAIAPKDPESFVLQARDIEARDVVLRPGLAPLQELE